MAILLASRLREVQVEVDIKELKFKTAKAHAQELELANKQLNLAP